MNTTAQNNLHVKRTHKDDVTRLNEELSALQNWSSKIQKRISFLQKVMVPSMSMIHGKNIYHIII